MSLSVSGNPSGGAAPPPQEIKRQEPAGGTGGASPNGPQNDIGTGGVGYGASAAPTPGSYVGAGTPNNSASGTPTTGTPATGTNGYAGSPNGTYGAGAPGGNNPAGGVISKDSSAAFSRAYYDHLKQNGNITAYTFNDGGGFGSPEEVNTVLNYAREFAISPADRAKLGTSPVGRLAIDSSDPSRKDAAAQMLSQVQLDLNKPADVFAMVAASYKTDGGNYNNGKLKAMLDAKAPGQYNYKGVGQTDVETLSAVYQALDKGQITLQDLMGSGGINNMKQYQEHINYVTGGRFTQDANNLKQGNYSGIGGPPNAGGGGGGGGGGAKNVQAPNGPMDVVNPMLSELLQGGGAGGFMQMLMMLLMLIMQLIQNPEMMNQLGQGQGLGSLLGGQTGLMGQGTGATGLASPFQMGGIPFGNSVGATPTGLIPSGGFSLLPGSTPAAFGSLQGPGGFSGGIPGGFISGIPMVGNPMTATPMLIGRPF